MNIDILKEYLSEEDFLSLSEKLKDTDIELITQSIHKSEIENLKKKNEVRNKAGLELMKNSPKDFDLAMSLLNLDELEKDGTEKAVSDLKEKKPFLFEERKVTTSLPHGGGLTDPDSLSDKDYYDFIYKKGEF